MKIIYYLCCIELKTFCLMKTPITTYRGWEISFDTEKETFYTVSDIYDRSETKSSYNSIKTFIDNFIKENNEFKPVYVESLPSGWRGKHTIKLIGIRKDNRFIYEDANGKKEQLSESSEKEYILINPDNEPIYKAIADCDTKIEILRAEKKELENTIIKKDLSEIKAKYSI